jgi:hypothetical protein
MTEVLFGELVALSIFDGDPSDEMPEIIVR